MISRGDTLLACQYHSITTGHFTTCTCVISSGDTLDPCLSLSLSAGYLQFEHCLSCMYACLFFDCIQGGWTALHVACMNGHDKVVKILLQAGADLNIQDKVSDLKR